MNARKILFIALFSFLIPAVCFAQTNGKSKTSAVPNPVKSDTQIVKSSPAFAEVLLRKTELSAELEELLISYKEDYPKVLELRFETDLLQKDLTRLLAVNASESPKLTLALGKLLVRKAELDADVWSLQKQYGDEHPSIKRAKRKAEVFDQAIKEILP